MRSPRRRGTSRHGSEKRTGTGTDNRASRISANRLTDQRSGAGPYQRTSPGSLLPFSRRATGECDGKQSAGNHGFAVFHFISPYLLNPPKLTDAELALEGVKATGISLIWPHLVTASAPITASQRAPLLIPDKAVIVGAIPFAYYSGQSPRRGRCQHFS